MTKDNVGLAKQVTIWLTVLAAVVMILAWLLHDSRPQSEVSVSPAPGSTTSESPGRYASRDGTEVTQSLIQKPSDQAEVITATSFTKGDNVQASSAEAIDLPVPRLPAPADQAARVQVPGIPQWAANMIADHDIAQQEVFAAVLDQHRQKFPTFLTAEQRQALAVERQVLERQQAAAVAQRAQELGLDIHGTRDDGTGYSIIGFDAQNRPITSGTMANKAAITTNVHLVSQNVGFDATYGANIDGGGFAAIVQDIGNVHLHAEIADRTEVRETNNHPDRWHSTHVAGIIGSQGLLERAQGMAPAVDLWSYVQSSTSEIYGAGMSTAFEPDTAIVGNASGNAPDNPAQSGIYNSSDRAFDIAMFDTPYYLQFYAAGNSGRDGWETIAVGLQDTKNSVTVANVKDVARGSDGSITGDVKVSPGSSRGPIDDGRIKPDLAANGDSVYSIYNDTTYRNLTGTSMASPNAAGSAINLQDYYSKRFTGQLMRAATLKTLMIHTADDVGNRAGDYLFGWGLINTLAGAQLIQSLADGEIEHVIREADLENNTVDTIQFFHDGNGPLRATLGWFDPGGLSTSSSNDRTADLRNDLDLRLIAPSGAMYQPFVMPYVTSGFQTNQIESLAVPGDNTTDNIEMIYLANAAEAGLWQVQISHKDNLENSFAAAMTHQPYSLVLSGADPENNSGDPAPTITNIVPDSGEAGASVTVKVTGNMFTNGLSLQLRRSGQTTLNATGVSSTATEIDATLSLPVDAEIGQWDVVVINPDNQTAVLTNAFTITEPPPPAVLAFAAATASISEASGTVMVQVARSGDTADEVSVDWATQADSAGVDDFTSANGTLTWSAGDSDDQAIVIAINDDALAEGDESFRLVLSDPSDAVLGTPDAVTITIVDNDNNVAPVVDAAADQRLIGLTATLAATVSDDDLPRPGMAPDLTWSLLSGPGTVTIADADQATTQVTVSSYGEYRFQLLADDSALSATDIQRVNFVSPLSVAIQPSTTSGPAPLTVDFDLVATGGLHAGQLPAGFVQHLTVNEIDQGTVADLSGNDLHGDVSGSVSIDPDGARFEAASFNGSNGQINLGDSAFLNTSSHDQRTVMLWFKADDLAAGTQMLLEYGGGSNGLNMYYHQNGNLYAGFWSNQGMRAWQSIAMPAAGQWHHLALVPDAAAAQPFVQAYLNGVAFGSALTEDISLLPSHSDDGALGGVNNKTLLHDGSSANGFIGQIDDLVVYNQVISAAEINHYIHGTIAVMASWDIDGQTTSTSTAFSHQFTELGDAIVSLEVSDGNDTVSDQVIIMITDVMRTIAITLSQYEVKALPVSVHLNADETIIDVDPPSSPTATFPDLDPAMDHAFRFSSSGPNSG